VERRKKEKHSAISRQHSVKELNRNGRKGRKGIESGFPVSVAFFASFAVNGFA
jgi:hypothetical protein